MQKIQPIIIIVAVAIALRVAWVLLVLTEPITDFLWYYEAAISIANGDGYQIRGELTAFWPVGYSAFLGVVFKLFGSSLLLTKFVNVLLSVLMIVFCYLLTKHFTKSEKAAIVAACLAAFHPNVFAYTTLVSSELLFLSSMLIAVYVSVACKQWGLFLSAVLWGLICHIKPQALFLPGIFLFAAFLNNRFFKNFPQLFRQAAMTYLVIAVVLVPWNIRNVKVFDYFTFISSNGGLNLLIGNGPEATGTFHFDEWGSDKSDLTDYMYNEVLQARRASTLAKEYIAEDPIRVLKLLPKKVYHLFAKDVEGFYWNREGFPNASAGQLKFFKAMSYIAQGFYVLLGLAFAWAVVRTKWKAHLFSSSGEAWLFHAPLVICYFTLITMVFFGSSRFHIPMLPFIWIFVASYYTKGRAAS